MTDTQAVTGSTEQRSGQPIVSPAAADATAVGQAVVEEQVLGKGTTGEEATGDAEGLGTTPDATGTAAIENDDVVGSPNEPSTATGTPVGEEIDEDQKANLDPPSEAAEITDTDTAGITTTTTTGPTTINGTEAEDLTPAPVRRCLTTKTPRQLWARAVNILRIPVGDGRKQMRG